MLDSWVLASGDDADTLVYEKEALPVGDFAKYYDGDNIQDITVRQGFIDQLVENVRKFNEVGVRIPLFKTHREDPDNERGLIQDGYIKPNSKGIPSFHIKVKFADTKARDQGLRNDVSVMCPPTFVDGKKNKYAYPLRHVALTSSPIIPGLDPFVPLVCSFDTPSGLAPPTTPPTGNKIMDMIDQILSKLGITAPEGTDEVGKLALILGQIGAPGAGAQNPGSLNLSFPPFMLSQMTQARKAVIDGLVKDETITVKLGQDLEKAYCTKDALCLDLSLSQEVLDDAGTEFDRVVRWTKTIAADRPLKRSGRENAVILGRDGQAQDNPVIAGAKKMAERAAARR